MIYRLLDQPLLYRLMGLLVAPGGEDAFQKKIKEVASRLPSANRLLDVGCGPASRLWQVGLHPVGVDPSPTYAQSFRATSGDSVVRGSAIELPFSDGAFDAIWSIGMLHHVADAEARHAVSEMRRVCRSGGNLVIIDGVLPEPVWRRPIAYLVRRLDRGRYMRREEELRNILRVEKSFLFERFTYTHNGLEAILAVGVPS